MIRKHVYIVAGDFGNTSSERLLPTGNWDLLPDMNEARQFLATAVINDVLYVYGGYDVTSVERFDPDVGVWEQLQPMTEAHGFAAAAVLCGQLYMCGGLDVDDGPLSSVECFNPTHNTWERLAPMRHARSEASVVVFDGRLFFNGGAEENDGSGNDFEDEDDDDGSDEGRRGEHGFDGPLGCGQCIDPVTGRWERWPDMRQVRVRPHVVVIFG